VQNRIFSFKTVLVFSNKFHYLWYLLCSFVESLFANFSVTDKYGCMHKSVAYKTAMKRFICHLGKQK